MTKKMTRTMLLGATLTAILFAFSASANAQGFNANRRSEPNRPTAQQTPNNRPNQPGSFSQHSTPQNRPSNFQQPQHHASKPTANHHQPTMNPPKPAPMPTVCNDRHHNSQPQVVIVGQAPKKPTLLEKIVNVFR